MSKLVNSYTDIRRYKCDCYSMGTITVPATQQTSSEEVCRSPICNAVLRMAAELETAKERKLRKLAEARAMLAENHASYLEISKSESEETLAFVLHEYSAFVIEQKTKISKLSKEIEHERSITAKLAVKIFVPSAPKLEKVVGKPIQPARREKKPVNISFQKIQDQRKIDPLPQNFTVGKTYYSGLAADSYDSFGF